MKQVIHIEDNAGWREIVRNGLLLSTDIEPVKSFENFDDFRKANYPQADLYICDRHLPERKGKHPDDETWRSLLSVINCLYPTSPIVILSSHPPKAKYPGVVNAMQKPLQALDFDYLGFRDKIEFYLDLNRGKK